MNVVFGCPIYERKWAVAAWSYAIEAACDYAEVEPEIVCAYSDSKDGTLDELHKHGVQVLDVGASPRRPADVADHIWGPVAYDHMASVRNSLLEYVALRQPHWFFSLDSDIILPRKALKRLISTAYSVQAGAIAPLVDLGQYTASPAWNFMLRNSLGFYYRPKENPAIPTQVEAIMAAMLIHSSMFNVYWNGNGDGEDYGWADNARKHKLFIDPQTVCEHRMRP